MWKKKNSNANPEVKLKPVFGIKPGLYLLGIYSAAIILILFILLFYPGIKNCGSMVSFTSYPEKAAVWLDDIYVGSTPCTEFIKRGNHSIIFQKNGFKDEKMYKDFGGKIFASKFFPKKAVCHQNLVLTDVDNMLSNSFKALSEWGLINSFSDAYHYQPVMQETVSAITDFDKDRDKLEIFLLESVKNIYSPQLLNDFIRAWECMNCSNQVMTPVSLISSLDKILVLFKENPLVINHLVSSSDSKTQTFIKDKIISEELDSFASNLKNTAYKIGKDLCINNMNLRYVPDGKYVLGDREHKPSQWAAFNENNPAAYAVDINEFYISSEITNGEFQKFYKTFQTSDSQNASARNVSFDDAKKYCGYLTENLPQNLKDNFYFRLPTEYEWEAFFSQHKEANHKLWNWCENDYFPAGTYYATSLSDNFSGAQKAVRGGQHIWTRGCQFPDWKTDFSGFRVVLVRK